MMGVVKVFPEWPPWFAFTLLRPLNAAAMAASLSADRVPTKNTRSFLAWHFMGFPNRRSRPFRINVVITHAVRDRTDATSPSTSWGGR
jgi:hypothetical protein